MQKPSDPKFIIPNWSAPSTIRAYTTTRNAGNMADVQSHLLRELLKLPSDPFWLTQVHGSQAIRADKMPVYPQADASFTRKANTVCAILTADCLPIFITNLAGSEIAAIHGGWRGLAAGIIDKTLSHLHSKHEDLLAWLGPAIGPDHFEVGEEVTDRFLQLDSSLAHCFRQHNHQWMADLYQIATHLLNKAGVTQITASHLCTYCDPRLFFSYRRDQMPERLASFIWIDQYHSRS